MVRKLLSPWRTARTWYGVVHGVLDLFVGTVTFSLVVTLLALSASLLIVFPLALPFVWLLFGCADLAGRIERSRAAALLGVHLPAPHAPFTSRGWFGRLGQRATSGSRWREIAYCLLLLPTGAIKLVVLTAVWSGSFALLILPLYIGSLPGDSAEFGLFELSGPDGALAGSLTGAFGLLLVAPWATVALSTLGGLIVRALLGPSPEVALRAQVTELEASRTAAEASRTAAVDSAEAERRRIERDLHDGAQQRLVGLAMDLGIIREKFDQDPDRARQLVTNAHQEAKAALAELRDLVRGFHPAILEDRGLDAALSAVVARCPIPVQLDIAVEPRPPASVESAAYFVVAEALTNVTKHAQATAARVSIARHGTLLAIDISDNGRGGATLTGGTGLRGLDERVRGLDGWMRVLSPPGGPTSVLVELPCGS
ncbi:sensor histidine kinase [Frankia sp. EI5c]|uniref:sensor histidine kinase n=1 Tax=Frankia sp. EI5c TaxID=683316 RepID=UPI0018FE2BA9|nr:sensor histidine kinase [Frankia sp. EI5c]